MKKNANSIIAAMISTAVVGVAVGYGITFWEHWQASQHALSSFNSTQNASQSKPNEQHTVEPAILDAPRKLILDEETAI